MIDHEPTYLVCQRIDRLATPPVKSRRGMCSECMKAVWVALSSPEGHPILCWQCASDEFRRCGDAEVALPTSAQWADIANFYRQGRN